MPEPAVPPKARPHPARRPPTTATPTSVATDDLPDYAELHAVSNFSFLRGASHPDELVIRAAELGLVAVAITDAGSLAGIVRAHVAAKEHGVQLLVGAEIALRDGPRLVLLAPDRAAYARLSRLLTRGRRRAEKGSCHLDRRDLEEHADGLLAIGLPPEEALAARAGETELAAAVRELGWLREVFPDRSWLAANLHEGPDDEARIERLGRLEVATALPLVAVGSVDAHVAERRPLRDVLHAIHHGTTVAELGHRLPAHGVRWLRSRAELAHLYRACPELLARTLDVASRCRFSLDELRYEYPDEVKNRDLRGLVEDGARWRWPAGVPEPVRQLIEHELALIAELCYESYFLTVYDIVRFARGRGILCQGRGSAANSAVCYCLGITSVDPDRFDVLFERFLSRDRNEPPDIDVDFEHERREEVIQYVYETYGRSRAALTATVISYRGRSALREVGRALGLSLDQVDRLAKGHSWWDHVDVPAERLRESGFDPGDATLQLVLRLVQEIQGFPRHLSQHVGGFVITQGRLDELVPIENAAMPDRTVIQWDKDDLDALGILKVDCLALGMLTAIHRAFDLITVVRGRELSLATVPAEVSAIYTMASRADTVGVFQIESRAQMAMLPRFRPRRFYDLVIEVAIVRPGPIQGGMVHPYLRRRAGLEAVTYPSEAVRSVLEKTLGVPIFQEQVMKLAVVAAGFTPGEADRLRRAMGAWRRAGLIEAFEEKLVRGMLERGYEQSFAEAVFRQIRGFGEYGFPESHAASFALLTYVSCWLKRFEPAIFTCALLNSLPMGFYGPAQLVADARTHGVPVRPVDVQRSEFDSTLETDDLPPLAETPDDPDLPPERYGEGGPALRLGFRLVKGFPRGAAERLVTARSEAPFTSVEDCVRRARLGRRHASLLAESGAFLALSVHRRSAWWQASTPLLDAPLFSAEDFAEPPPDLPAPDLAETVLADYLRAGLSLEAHPLALLREELRAEGLVDSAELARVPDRNRVAIAGLAICRQRPATASGVLFITLEDEHGFVNAIVRRREQERDRRALLGGSILMIRGHLERQGEVAHLLAEAIEDFTPRLAGLRTSSRNFH